MAENARVAAMVKASPADLKHNSYVGVTSLPAQFEEWEIELHGRRVIYRVAGSGPPVVLIHGMLNSSSHWHAVARSLGSTVIISNVLR